MLEVKNYVLFNKLPPFVETFVQLRTKREMTATKMMISTKYSDICTDVMKNVGEQA